MPHRGPGNRTRGVKILGLFVRTLRHKLDEYSAESFDIPNHSTHWLTIPS